MSGRRNDPCTVTILKIGENQMDNRGSKSESVTNSVKEQRVDGSYCIRHVNVCASSSKMQLRCILTNFERFSRVKIPSKQLNVKKFSTSNSSSNVNPWFWTGLIDAEGSFSIIVSKSQTHKLGWRVEAKFQMGLHQRDLTLLLLLQQILGGVGTIYEHPTINKVNYSINSKKDLTNLINHLEKYPLLTQKAADFILFKEVVDMLNNKAHLSNQGLNQIINMKASMNLGLSDFLKSEFNKFTPVERQIIKTESIPDSNWVAGFVTGDGSFDVKITQQQTNNIGYRVQLRFRISLIKKYKMYIAR